METQTARRASRRLPMLVAAVAVLVVGASALLWLRGGDEGDDLQLSDVPEGVSTRTVDGRPLFLVREGGDVQAFVPDPRHVRGSTLWWCPNEELFVGPAHGEQFDQDGLYIAGPSEGGLNTYMAEVEGERLTIDTSRIIEGPDRDHRSPRRGVSGGDGTAWNSGPTSFCAGAITTAAG